MKMPSRKTCTRAVSLTLIATVSTIAFAQNNGQDSSSKEVNCNPVVAAGIGALVGGLLGKKDRAKGAAIGAGVATLACIGINYSTRQVKSAEQVKGDFKAKNAGNLPEKTTLVQYETQFEPDNKTKAGNSKTLTSYIEVVQGTNSQPPVIEEEITVYGPDGKELKKTRKAANANGDTGAFQSNFNLKLPEGVPQGVYPFKTVLFVDGQPAANKEIPLQVVFIESESVVRVAYAHSR